MLDRHEQPADRYRHRAIRVRAATYRLPAGIPVAAADAEARRRRRPISYDLRPTNYT